MEAIAVRDTSGPMADERLPLSEINAALGTYPQENRFIRAAIYGARSISIEMAAFPHPFHHDWIRHLTREHVAVYVTQASYLLVAAAIQRADIEGVSLHDYYTACRNETALITDLEMRFREFEQLSGSITVHANITESRTLRGSMFFRAEYQISRGAEAGAWLRMPRTAH